MAISEHPSTREEIEEAEFTRQILADPRDRIVRHVFADWLDERGRKVQALYMRQVRTLKFLKLVAKYGGWAMTPEFTRPPPPLTVDINETHWPVTLNPAFSTDGPRARERTPEQRYDAYKFTSGPPPERSVRCAYWIEKIQRGWLVPKWLNGAGYYTLTKYFGVYVWEYIHVIQPMLRNHEAPTK